jgi:Vinculin family
VFLLLSVGGKGNAEAAENRNYLAGRMTDEINEIIRVLQLTTYDEDEWDADQLTAMKRAFNALDSKMQAAIDWLEVSLLLDPPSSVCTDVSFVNLCHCRIRRPCVVELAKNPSGRSLN